MAEAKEMMYAITWNESKTHRVQVGITPKRLLKELKQNQISNVVSNMPVYKGMEIYVVNSKTKIIEGATDKNKIEKVYRENVIQQTAIIKWEFLEPAINKYRFEKRKGATAKPPPLSMFEQMFG